MAESEETRRAGAARPNEDFITHLCALKKAIDMVQPLADYRGNFTALHAVCVLDEAIAAVLADIAPFIDHTGARAAIRQATERA